MLFPYATCGTCGWHDKRANLKCDADKPISEMCPDCGSDDTWWTADAPEEDE